MNIYPKKNLFKAFIKIELSYALTIIYSLSYKNGCFPLVGNY